MWLLSSRPADGNRGRPSSSLLPAMRGASGAAYNTSLSCVSISARFSSTTTMVSSPAAKRRAPSGSSGKGIATLYSRTPSRRAPASSMPRSSNACRTSR